MDKDSDISAIDPKTARTAGVVVPVATVTLVKVVSALPEFVLGALGPFIVSELDISRTLFGSLASVYFVVASAVSLAAGAKVDTLRLHTTLSVQLALGLSGLLLLSIAPTFWLLGVAMIVGGLSASVSTPVSNKVIAVRVARRAQGLAMGINQSGIQIATLIAGVVLPPMAGIVGWRLAVAVLLPVPVVALVLAWVGFRESPRRSNAPTAAADDAPSAPLPAGLIGWLAAFAFLMGSGTSGVSAFVALFAFEMVDVPASRAGTIIVALGITGVISRISWGYIVGRIGRPWRFLPFFALVAASSTLMFAYSPRAGEPLVWVAALAFGVGAAAWSPVVHLSLVRLLGASATGRGSGRVQSAFFLGMIVSPLLFGGTVDRFGYVVAWFVLTGVFTTAAVLSTTWLVRSRRAEAVERTTG